MVPLESPQIVTGGQSLFAFSQINSQAGQGPYRVGSPRPVHQFGHGKVGEVLKFPPEKFRDNG